MSEEAKFQHLNLRSWPFTFVPPDEATTVWVGRPATLREIRMILRSAGRVSASSLYLLWAALGAGKTHTLRHMEHLVHDQPSIVPLYVVTPKGIRSFVEIYRAIVQAMVARRILPGLGRKLFDQTKGYASSDVDRALFRIGMYAEDEAEIAISWLLAEKVSLVALRDVKITGRIDSTSGAIDALNRLLEVLTTVGGYHVLLLMDEVQELDVLGRRLPECVGGLHKIFDKNSGLTMVLSFTYATQGAMRDVVGPTLLDRTAQILTLPALTAEDAEELALGLIEAHSVDSSRAPYPFTASVVRAVAEELAQRTPLLTPRDVIRGFNRILRRADLDILDREISEVDGEYGLRNLPEANGANEESP